MKEPKLQIKPKKYTGETTVTSIRIPKDMLRDIDAVANQTGRTRNELFLTCMEFAMSHMEIARESEEKVLKIVREK